MGYSTRNMELVYEFRDILLSVTTEEDEDNMNTKQVTKRSRKVAFAASSGESSLDLPSPLVRIPGWEDDVNSGMLWYTNEELHAIRREARDLLSHPERAFDPAELRGLERHGSRERTRLKNLTNKFILATAIKHKGDENSLGLVCQDCTSWARNLALERGGRDELMARGCDDDRRLNVSFPPPGAVSSPKRVISDIACERRVRQRLEHL